MLQPSIAIASTASIGGEMDDDYWVDYESERTIYNWDTSIWFKKTDGPGLWMQWYRCGPLTDRSVTGPGPAYWQATSNYWSDPDPTLRKWLDGTFLQGTKFCLSVLSNGSNDYDWFYGQLDWDVTS